MPGMKQRAKEKLSLFLLRHSRFFDEKRYREQAGLPAGTDAAAHYLAGGWREHDPSRYFRQEGYLAAREDVRAADVCPLAHWLLYSRKPFPGLNLNRYRRLPVTRGIRRELGRLRCRKALRENRGARILAAVHLDDPRAAGEIFEYLKNLRPYDWDLAVTVPEGTDPEPVRQAAEKLRRGAEVRTCEDRGQDVLPFLETVRRLDLNAYDIVMKIRPAAQDPRRGQLREGRFYKGRDRFLYGMEAVCGAGRIHGNVSRLMRGEADLIASARTLRQDPPFRETLVTRALGQDGPALPAGYRFDESGIFAMRAETAAQLAASGIRTESLEPSGRPSAPLTRAAQRALTGFVPAERQDAVKACALRERRAAKRERDAGRTSAASVPAEGQGVIAFAVSETGSGAVKGDAFTALEMAQAMESLGWKTKMLPRNGENWYDVGEETDVLVSLLEDYEPGEIRGGKPGLLTVAWARNWFDRWAESPAMADYGLVLASGRTACRQLEKRLGRDVILFPIAANAERFREGGPEGGDGEAYRCDICFTGNRFSPREIEKELVPAELPWSVAIWGDGWDGVQAFASCVKGHLPYEEIPKVYRGAKIALDDATPSTKEAGSVNSRVFDALAAGCLVLTNNVTGAEETFGGLLPVFRNREELEALLKRYLEDDAARREKTAELRRFVLERHTYAARAEQLDGLIRAWQAEE